MDGAMAALILTKDAQGHTKKTGEETGEENAGHLVWAEKVQADFSTTVSKISVTTYCQRNVLKQIYFL